MTPHTETLEKSRGKIIYEVSEFLDINEFYYLLNEYALDNENYNQWREIHKKAFGDIFFYAFDGILEAQIHLTAALIKISKRDFNGGLSILLMLKNVSVDDFDCFAINYFIGLCYEFIGDEEQMNKHYGIMEEYSGEYAFLIAFHPYYRTAKFAQRKSENTKALNYYSKALALYSGKEFEPLTMDNRGQIYYDMGTVFLSDKNYVKSREFLEKSYECSPAENPQRNYVMAILCAVEGKSEEAKKLVEGLPDYLKSNCEQIISQI